MGNIRKWLVLICLLITSCGYSNESNQSIPPSPPILGDCTMSANALLASYGNPLIVVDSADFDGANDYLTNSSLAGTTDSTSGIISFWYRIDGGNGIDRGILVSYGNAPTYPGTFALTHNGFDNRIGFSATSNANVGDPPDTLVSVLTSPLAASASWHHILLSFNTTTSQVHMYVDDISDAGNAYVVPGTIDSSPIWSFGHIDSGTFKINGCLAEFYYAQNQYLDFSIESNRRKFISPGKKPVYLGTDGSIPTGTAPIIYSHLNDTETPANFAINRGTGGNFTVTGALTTGSTSPSD